MVDKILNKMIYIILLIMTFVIAIQIGFRYILNLPLSWTEELARYLQIWLTIIGGIWATRNQKHIKITSLTDRIPNKYRNVYTNINLLLQATFMIILLWASIKFNLSLKPIVSAALRIPLGFIYWGAAVFALFSIIELINLLMVNIGIGKHNDQS